MEKNFEFKPHPLFDALLADMRRRNGDAVRNNDAALCRMIGIQPAAISKMRKGVQPVTDSVRVKVMRTFGWSIKKLDELAPPAAEEGTVQ